MEIVLTEGGRAVLDDAPRTAQVRMVEALGAMPPAQVRTLADALAALVRQAGVQDLPASFFLEDEGAPMAEPRRWPRCSFSRPPGSI